jgi:hypothetical protein
MYNDTITLFNRHRTQSGTMWYATVLHGVNVIVDKSAIIAKYGEKSQDSAVLNIRYRREDTDIYVGKKRYLPPKEWSRQMDDALSASITFASGQQFDFFMIGEWDGGAVVDDDTYTEGFYEHANRRYDFVFAITSVSQFSVIPHFEITAK